MFARRLFFAAMAHSLLSFPMAANAETLSVGPNACPVPPTVGASAVTIIAGGNIEAVDLNPGRRAADGVTIIYDRRFDGWASRRLFARFELEGETGLPPQYTAETDCIPAN